MNVGENPKMPYPQCGRSIKTYTMYPLRTAGKGTFEWGAKIARIWVHKGTILAKNDYFHRVGMVAIISKVPKN